MTATTNAEAPGWPGEPLHQPVMFVQSGGAVDVHLSYLLFQEAVLLSAFVTMPGYPPGRIWRQHWTSYEGSVSAAEDLADDALEYLQDSLGHKNLRPAEDLDYDDFVEHLRARLNKEFH